MAQAQQQFAMHGGLIDEHKRQIVKQTQMEVLFIF